MIGVALFAGCGGNSPTGPGNEAPNARSSESGVIQIVTVTTGLPVDPNGYELTIDGEPAGRIGTTETRRIDRMVGPMHEVVLSDVAANCEVQEGRKRSVAVQNGRGWVAYLIVCSKAERLKG